jgi:uncharacterized protein YjbJ (UPF0337 family)
VNLEDKMKNKVDQAGGAVKETVGKLTDDEKMQAEGHMQHAKAVLAEDAEKVKDSVVGAAGHIKDAFKKQA